MADHRQLSAETVRRLTDDRLASTKRETYWCNCPACKETWARVVGEVQARERHKVNHD